MDIINENELKLNIRDQAFAQAEAYARLTKKAFGSHFEIGFYLVGNEDGFIVEEVTLPPAQSVTHTSIKIDGSAVIQVGSALESQGKKSLGWCHSHADFTPFQSSIDNENTEDILRQISESNLTYIDRELSPLQFNSPDSILRFMDGEDMVEIDLGDVEIASKIRISGVQAKRKLKVGKAYSLVLNALGDKPHAEVIKFLNVEVIFIISYVGFENSMNRVVFKKMSESLNICSVVNCNNINFRIVSK